MINKNYYEKFGLKENASDAEIIKAYRKLALKYHPDRNNGDSKFENIFKQINEIYETLSDKDKRKAYDEKLRILNTNAQTENARQSNRNENAFEESRNESFHHNSFTKNKQYDFKSFSRFENNYMKIFKWLGAFIILIVIGALNGFFKDSSKSQNKSNNSIIDTTGLHGDSEEKSGNIEFDRRNSIIQAKKDSSFQYSTKFKGSKKHASSTNKGDSLVTSGDIKF